MLNPNGRARTSMTLIFNLLKLFLFTLEFQIHLSSSSATALILSVGDKCGDTLGKSETVSSRELEIVNGTVFGVVDPPICDPSMPLECISGRCQCKRGYTISRNGTRCLEIARNGLDSLCEESIQCWKGLLGRLSECKRDSGRCRCYESESLPIVFHQGRCYYGESLGDFCLIENLCEATIPNANCKTTCQCKEGFVASWDKSRCLEIANGLNSSCEENVQCEKSVLGTLSECQFQKTGQGPGQCQCMQIPMVPTVFFGGRCYFGASLGDVCQVNSQCQAKTEHSTCGKDGKCGCEDGWIPNGNQSMCLQIPSADGSSSEFECFDDVQCIKVFGDFARCDARKRKCECYLPQDQHWRQNETTTPSSDLDKPVTSMVMIGSKCHTAKHLGQSCKFNKQCSATTENAVCYNGLCECREESHLASNDGRKCLEIREHGQQCDHDLQCVGQLLRCHPDKKKCECSNLLPVVYYDKKCYFHRQLESPCSSNIECKAGGNFLAECLHGRCRCTNGTQPFTDHSCTHSSSGHSSVVSKHSQPINFISASLIAILCMSSNVKI